MEECVGTFPATFQVETATKGVASDVTTACLNTSNESNDSALSE